MIRAPIVVAALITALCALAVSRLGGGGMLPYLVGINVATVVIYGWDKLAASFGRYRINGLALHALELFGGSPAALVSQAYMRHLDDDTAYQRAFKRILWFQGVLLAVITALYTYGLLAE